MRAVASSSPSVKRTPSDTPTEVVSIRPHASLAAGVCIFGRMASSEDRPRGRMVRFDIDRVVLHEADPAVHVGDTVEFGYLQHLVRQGEETFVVSVVTELLARREHSTADLHRKLTMRGFSVEAREYAIERMISAGYQSDERFAAEWVRSRMQRKNVSRAALLAGLQQAGVGRRDAEMAVDQYETEHPNCFEEALIAAIAAMGAASREQKYRRLIQRGFENAHITHHLS